MLLDASLLHTQHDKVWIRSKSSKQRKKVMFSPIPRWSSYWKGSLWVLVNDGRPTNIYIQMYVNVSVWVCRYCVISAVLTLQTYVVYEPCSRWTITSHQFVFHISWFLFQCCRPGCFDVSFMLLFLFFFVYDEWQRNHNFKCSFYSYTRTNFDYYPSFLMWEVSETKMELYTSHVESFSPTNFSWSSNESCGVK